MATANTRVLWKGAISFGLAHIPVALHAAARIGIARVMTQTREHLAALVPSGPTLLLNLLRWADEIRSIDELTLPGEGTKAAGINARKMA